MPATASSAHEVAHHVQKLTGAFDRADRLQKQGAGRVAPESFTHGSSEQRMRWLKRGMDSGRPQDCDTFAATSL